MEGSPGSALCRRWNVASFPGIYIIDAKGIIRYKGVRDQEMEDAVLKLLAEMEAPK
jgi:hypothetical protein